MFKVVDLFAGPGGLAEGFSAVRDEDGNPVFEMALSVEKETSAFSTLRLRSFTRQFRGVLPGSYYGYMAGEITRNELIAAHPEEWKRACDETLQLELGSPGSNDLIDPLVDRICQEAGGRSILVGGPPCQAYSLVGRARNKGKIDYVASEDHRHFLYKEYIRILSRLRPAAFIMENVKGFLSAKVDGEHIFSKVIADLSAAGGGAGSYTIIPWSQDDRKVGARHLLKSEDFGVPQRRHRIILFGVRSDVIHRLGGLIPSDQVMEPWAQQLTVAEAIAGMPRLRSGLSKTADSNHAWRTTVAEAFRIAAKAAFDEEDEQFDEIARRLHANAEAIVSAEWTPPIRSSELGGVRNNELASWLIDPYLDALPNHESRSHMPGDLARYGFAATFAALHGHSPKANDFPANLAPAHRNWSSGKFNDRFRVQCWSMPSTTVTSHIAKDGHYFIHPDPHQCRSLTVREAARLQTFPDNYLFEGNRTEQFTQVGNAVPPLLAHQIGQIVWRTLRTMT